jgi:Flp pilus assembly protein TadD
LILDQAEYELQKGNTTIAINILRKLIDKWPDYYLAYNDLGIIYWKSGDKRQAFQYVAARRLMLLCHLERFPPSHSLFMEARKF